MKIQFKQLVSKTIAILTALFAFQAMAAEGPYELTQKAADKLFADLKADQGKINADPNHLKTLVRQDLMPYVHVNLAGSTVLGQYFKSTTPEQRERFFAEFGKFIEREYAQILTMYKGQNIQIQPAQFDGDSYAKVTIKIVQEQPLKATFLWRKNSKTGNWQVYDMIGETFSVLEAKQKEWAPILRKEGIDALTEQVQRAAAVPVTMKK
ncbi:MAG: phospholipid-binding protein MlaC [Lonepinella koalarum]|nr:phospholipid-binding protein MlaC [Lonepinella koalarum]